jgi:hypothetical protein
VFVNLTCSMISLSAWRGAVWLLPWTLFAGCSRSDADVIDGSAAAATGGSRQGDVSSGNAAGAPDAVPPAAAGEGGRSDGAGEAPTAAGGNAGEGPLVEAGAGGEALDGRRLPSCEVGQEGAFCGQHLSPKGDVNTRYFCDLQAGLLAQAPCPGICDPDYNTCKAGTGTGQGDYTRPLAQCLHCFSEPCLGQMQDCQQEALCAAHYTCLTECDASQVCEDACQSAFAEEPLLAELIECANDSGCAMLCAAVF